MRIALRGRAFSGKSTLAKYLADEKGYRVLEYSRGLKMMAAVALSAIGIPTSVADIERDKERNRAFLIALGERAGFDEGLGVARMIEDAGNPSRAVIDNIRFPAQWQIAKAYGYTLVTLLVNDQTQQVRAWGAGRSAAQLAELRASQTEQFNWGEGEGLTVNAHGSPELIWARIVNEIAGLQIRHGFLTGQRFSVDGRV